MTTLRRNCCRFGEVFVAVCTGNCHADNFHCIAVGCGNCVEMAILPFFFSFLGITSELFDEFLNYQPSFYYRTAIPLSILFHSILFPYISFQILFLWILFLMWATYTYHCLYHFSLNVLLYVCFMYHYFVPCIYIYVFICIYVYLFIYLFIESRGLRPDGANVICFTMYRL